MNPNDHQQPPRGSPAAWGIAVLRWAQGGLIAACLAALVVACGGGVGSGGTGGFASGPISGFGSVIVNAVRFDEGDAQAGDGGYAVAVAEMVVGNDGVGAPAAVDDRVAFGEAA